MGFSGKPIADFNLTQVAGNRATGLCGRLRTKAEGRSWGASVRLDDTRAGKGATGGNEEGSGAATQSRRGFGLPWWLNEASHRAESR